MHACFFDLLSRAALIKKNNSCVLKGNSQHNANNISSDSHEINTFKQLCLKVIVCMLLGKLYCKICYRALCLYEMVALGWCISCPFLHPLAWPFIITLCVNCDISHHFAFVSSDLIYSLAFHDFNIYFWFFYMNLNSKCGEC